MEAAPERAVQVQLAGARKTTTGALVGVRGGPCRGLQTCPHARIQCVRDDVICLRVACWWMIAAWTPSFDHHGSIDLSPAWNTVSPTATSCAVP
jgi:hypothetical protein